MESRFQGYSVEIPTFKTSNRNGLWNNKISPVTLYNRPGENGDNVGREFADVVGHPEEHARAAQMVAAAHVQPRQGVAVQDH